MAQWNSDNNIQQLIASQDFDLWAEIKGTDTPQWEKVNQFNVVANTLVLHINNRSNQSEAFANTFSPSHFHRLIPLPPTIPYLVPANFIYACISFQRSARKFHFLDARMSIAQPRFVEVKFTRKTWNGWLTARSWGLYRLYNWLKVTLILGFF